MWQEKIVVLPNSWQARFCICKFDNAIIKIVSLVMNNNERCVVFMQSFAKLFLFPSEMDRQLQVAWKYDKINISSGSIANAWLFIICVIQTVIQIIHGVKST